MTNKTGDVTSDNTDKDYIHFLKEEINFLPELKSELKHLLPRATNKETK